MHCAEQLQARVLNAYESGKSYSDPESSGESHGSQQVIGGGNLSSKVSISDIKAIK